MFSFLVTSSDAKIDQIIQRPVQLTAISALYYKETPSKDRQGRDRLTTLGCSGSNLSFISYCTGY